MPALDTTVVLIHGLWMTPRSWEHWVARYEERGFRVLAPAYPGLEVEVEQLRDDPAPIARLRVEQVVAHYERIIRGLDRPPILMGHAFGGAFVQLLLDRGLGTAGIAIDSVQVEGAPRGSLRSLLATWPVLCNPANRWRAVPLSPEQFHDDFANTLSTTHARAAYQRYLVPACGRLVWDAMLASLAPRAATRVRFDKGDRAPLLFIAGGEDHVTPPALNKANARRYTRGLVAYKEFPGRAHFTVGEPGWEAVADFALDWALEPSASE